MRETVCRQFCYTFSNKESSKKAGLDPLKSMKKHLEAKNRSEHKEKRHDKGNHKKHTKYKHDKEGRVRDSFLSKTWKSTK